MTEEEDAIPVDIRLSHIEIAADQRDQKRIVHIVEKFEKDLFAFAQVGLAALLTPQSWRFKPLDLSDLKSVSDAHQTILVGLPHPQSLRNRMQGDRFETSKLEKAIDISEKTIPVMLLHITGAPEPMGNDLRQHRLAKC